MAPLPQARSQTVDAIWRAIEAEAGEPWDGWGLSISMLGGDCDAALWFQLRWASKPEHITGQKQRLFATGHLEESRLIADLRRAGMEVVDVDPDTGKQIKTIAIGGHLRGKLDGCVFNVPEAPATWHVLECKSHNEKSFNDLVKKGLQTSKPAHYAQCQVYMHETGNTRCLYVAVNKNNDAIHVERVKYDALFCAQLYTRLHKIISANVAPARISNDPEKYPCTFCAHKAVCHKQEFARSNCRTCLHATPCIDEGSDEPRWMCERFGIDSLSIDEQRAGCPAHLFLPDCVPGEQVDAGADFVVYAMRNGTQWRDGVPANTRFWSHPESGDVWSSDKDEFANSDGCVEEIDVETFVRLKRERGDAA